MQLAVCLLVLLLLGLEFVIFGVYCYDLNERTLCYKRECHMFVQGTILYAPNTHSAILAFTGDYDPLEWEDWYTENYLENGEEEDAEYEDDGMENEEVIIPCYIYELPYDSDDYKELYYFAGMDGISPFNFSHIFLPLS